MKSVRNPLAKVLSCLLVIYLDIECGMECAYIIDAQHSMTFIIVMA